MDFRKVKKLIDLLDDSGVAEIEIREGDDSLRITRYGAHGPVVTAAPAPIEVALEAPSVSRSAVMAADPTPAENILNAPMVGTFYISASPETKPFVDVGSAVKRGDTACVIEAMKIMNQIEAHKDGVVKEILVENGQPVEFDQPLFVIE